MKQHFHRVRQTSGDRSCGARAGPPTPPMSACATALAALFLLLAGLAQAQQQEVSTHDEPATFRTTTNLVLVPVVVRDYQGHPVGDLKQSDFQLFDRGKLQLISKFTVEKSDGKETVVAVPAETAQPAGMQVVAPAAAAPIPDRFVAYLFDDVHAHTGDLIMARDAADRHMKKMLGPKTRAAIYTTSGQNMLDFTDDRDKLHQTLFLLQPRPIAEGVMHECPDLTYFWADRIRNQNDQEALQFAVMDAASCGSPNPSIEVRAAVARVIARNEQSSNVSLEVLRGTVQRMAAMPGQRTIVLVSPGFLTLIGSKNEENLIIDKAIRASVVINALDVRGLSTETRDPSKPPPMLQGAALSQYTNYVEQMAHEVFNAQSDVMAEVAAGTGGTFYHNSNDMDSGFQRVAGIPEVRYVLGFSPQELKMDGSIHGLKVTLAPNSHHYELDARRNYTAPKSISDPVEMAKEEIREALFTRDELKGFPLELHTEYFKTGPQTARLSMVAHVDLKTLRFKKENGRNQDDLTLMAGLFDHNGNYISGTQKTVNLRLLDANLERWLWSGITVPASFEVKPGAYVLRLVVRDSSGPLLAAQNGVVEIP